ncbi:MAG: hypothetical protein KZQ89_04300 [Candidatus Thiodiazotropha sp. (ex Lucinoma kastoroae)]|nr:hypothetical protein [Candidatus Thiodiazotropha sp. (ex Lucinoma kastoroae)]
MSNQLPSLTLADWQPSRDTLHQFSRITGKLRGHYMPKSKHWWHITLNVSAHGLTTTPFPIAGQNLELILDLSAHRLTLCSSNGWSCSMPLIGQSTAGLCHWISESLLTVGVELEEGLFIAFDSDEILPYDIEAISRFRQAINWVDAVFKAFKGRLREETDPVQIFPHHLDLSMNWFSGRLVPGIDPAGEERADEQLNFGFVTGDGSISESYFYVTAYPALNNWANLELPEGVYWHTEGWSGAILPYAALVSSDRPHELLLDYLQTVQVHGAKLMT